MAQRAGKARQAKRGDPPSGRLQVAIDGPVGAGKSTAGKLLAARLGYRFLDTGLMYRVVTVAALDAGVHVDDPAALTVVARNANIGLAHEAGVDRLMLDGHDITQRLRSPEVERAISAVSAVHGVREELVGLQRKIAADGGIVVVGRDIGTVVLRDAAAKFFLTVSPETRAHRRHEEIQARGRPESLREVLEQLKRRDELDSSRAESPLAQASDAVVIDTGGLSLEQVVDEMERTVHERASPG